MSTIYQSMTNDQLNAMLELYSGKQEYAEKYALCSKEVWSRVNAETAACKAAKSPQVAASREIPPQAEQPQELPSTTKSAKFGPFLPGWERSMETTMEALDRHNAQPKVEVEGVTILTSRHDGDVRDIPAKLPQTGSQFGYLAEIDLEDYAMGQAPHWLWLVKLICKMFQSQSTRVDVWATAMLMIEEQEQPSEQEAFFHKVCSSWFRMMRGEFESVRGENCFRRKLMADFDLCDVLARVTPPVEQLKAQAEMEKLAIVLMDTHEPLGTAIKVGMTIEQAADHCGISLRTAYNRIHSVKSILNPSAC